MMFYVSPTFLGRLTEHFFHGLEGIPNSDHWVPVHCCITRLPVDCKLLTRNTDIEAHTELITR